MGAIMEHDHGELVIIGRSKSITALFRFIANTRISEAPVLITGETGTGKELVARAIHRSGARHGRPFFTLDCSVLNKNLLESELFGHVRGAFTGAVADKKGVFEMAAGSTLFLDEIGEMSLDTQVKLLRVLEEGTFRPVGSAEEKKVSVRIIAATNRDLKLMIQKGAFREDLYYRINVIAVHLPVLRERKEDIPALIDYFVKKLNTRNGVSKQFTPEAMSLLAEYSYPGNVRELRNIIERVFMLSEREIMGVEDLPPEVRRVIKRPDAGCGSGWNSLSLRQIIKRTEKKMISRMLRLMNGNKVKAARMLNISRSTLYAKMEEYGIE
jgi:two-component system response regulator AtoC